MVLNFKVVAGITMWVLILKAVSVTLGLSITL